MLKTLKSSIREYKKPTILCLIFIVLEAVAETAIPFITARLANSINDGVEIPVILQYGGVLLTLAFLSLAFGAAGGVYSAQASSGFAKNLRQDMMYRIQTYDFENIDRFSSSSLVTRLTTDVQNISFSYMMIIRTAVRGPLMLIFSVFMGFYMGGALAAVFLVSIPILAFCLFYVAKKAMPAFRRVFRKYDKLNESVEENVRGMRVVKGFARQTYEKEKFRNAAVDIQKDFTYAEKLVALNTPVMQLCLNINSVIILFLGAKFVIESRGMDINIGQVSALITYGVSILFSLMMLSFVYVIITISIESGNRVCEVLREEPGLKTAEDPVAVVADGSIDFDHVNFKYSEKAKLYALSNIDLHIKSGMTVGILGDTGSGKSSLIQLIPRLYDVTEGCVKVGGVDVRDYDIKVLRDSVSVVLQKNEVFSGTIRDNLKWGNENATDEEIQEACRLAQATEFINSFPDGYDTRIEQSGTNVSGGQKQRLCIARALLKRPKILILDDSTSAVDTKTDARIRAGFEEFIPETTKIIIAQRIASVREADLIILMHNGTIQDMGTDRELMERSRTYRDIYEEQMSGTEQFGTAAAAVGGAEA
ncbi:MAG: ABC transporter ATP-binding protein [Lachnospiraceae bacterium]|nr:ABC transporter ATP-binding protein [Lachnospiraceae bacterium]